MPELPLTAPKPNIPDNTPKGNVEKTKPEDFPINFEPFPGLDESLVLDWAKKCNTAWEAWFNQGMNPEQKRMERYTKLFMCQNEDLRQPHLPIPNAIIETLHANVMRVLSQRPKVVEAKPKFKTTDNNQQLLMEDLVNQEILFQEDARDKIAGIFKTAAINQYAIVKSYWEEIEVNDINPVYSLVGGVSVLRDEGKTVKQRGRWVFEQCAEMNFAFDPDCITKLARASWVRNRDWKPVSELLQMQQKGKLQNVDAIMNRATSSAGADSKNKDEKLKESTGQGRKEGPEKKVQIDEFYAVISWEDTTGDEAQWRSERFHFLIAADDFLIKFDKCGLVPDRNPYILARICKRPNQLVGNSVLVSLLDLEDQANTSMMKKRALISNAADNPTFYNPASGFDPSKTRGRQGGYIPITGQAPTRIAVDSEPIRILNEDITSMIGLMRESTPANEQFQGMAPTSDTATEANINYQTGGVRFGEIVDTFSSDLFPQLARELVWQAVQFSQDGDLFVSQSSIDGNSQSVTLKDLAGEWDFVASSMTTEANRKGEIQGKLQISEQLMTLQEKAPQVMMDENGKPVQFAFLKLLIEEVLPSMGIRTGKKYLVPAPPPPPPPPMPPVPPPPPVLDVPGKEWYVPPAPGAPQAGPIDANTPTMPPGMPTASNMPPIQGLPTPALGPQEMSGVQPLQGALAL